MIPFAEVAFQNFPIHISAVGAVAGVEILLDGYHTA